MILSMMYYVSMLVFLDTTVSESILNKNYLLYLLLVIKKSVAMKELLHKHILSEEIIAAFMTEGRQ